MGKIWDGLHIKASQDMDKLHESGCHARLNHYDFSDSEGELTSFRGLKRRAVPVRHGTW